MKFRNYSIRPGHLILCLGSGRGRHNIRHIFGILGKKFFFGYLKTEPAITDTTTSVNKEDVSEVWQAFDETFEKMGKVFKNMK